MTLPLIPLVPGDGSDFKPDPEIALDMAQAFEAQRAPIITPDSQLAAMMSGETGVPTLITTRWEFTDIPPLSATNPGFTK
jgi:hypothetical protein